MLMCFFRGVFVPVIQPVKEGPFADLDNPPVPDCRESFGADKLVGAGSGNPHDLLDVGYIQYKGKFLITVCPFFALFHTAFPSIVLKTLTSDCKRNISYTS